MFGAVAVERQVVFSWLPPLITHRNGIITDYTLSCSPSPSSLPLTLSSSGSLTVPEFNPNTQYSCSVLATNSQGSGPLANTSFTTLEDCETVIILMSALKIFITQIHIFNYVLVVEPLVWN